jgi:hypothetical protein
MSAPGREQRVAPPAATHPTPQPLMVEAATPICDSLILMPEPAAVATGDRADDRDLQAVEDPYGPQSQEDQPVPACPRQPVQARRDARLDDPAFSQRLCRHALLLDLQRHARSRNSRTSRRTARASQLGNEGPTSSEDAAIPTSPDTEPKPTPRRPRPAASTSVATPAASRFDWAGAEGCWRSPLL